MNGIFQRPFPLHKSWRKQLLRALVFGLFIFFFLAIFQPFGLSTYPYVYRAAAIYGGVTFLVMCTTSLGLFPVFPSWFDPERWTSGKEILWAFTTVLAITAVNIWVALEMGFISPEPRWFLIYLGYTAAIGIIPITVSVLLKERKEARKFSLRSSALTATLHEPFAPEGDETLVIRGETKQDELVLKPASLAFVRADDNYLEVFALEKNRLEKALIRKSLKSLEEEVQAFPKFKRVHRSYLVNLDRVTKVSGNAQGFRLHIGEEEIPVSRNFNSEINTWFS